MKKTLFLLIVLTLLTSCIKDTPYDCSMDMASGEFFKSEQVKGLVLAYGDAMDSLAMNSVDFGGDTETAWAADTVHTIWSNCKAREYDFIQTWADILSMQKYFAYGITYVPGIVLQVRFYKDLENDAFFALSALNHYKTETDSIRSVLAEHPDAESLVAMSSASITCVELFGLMAYYLGEIDSEPPMVAFQNAEMVNSIKASQDSINLLCYKWYLDGAAAFIPYSTLVYITCPSEENYEQLKPMIIQHANVLDKHQGAVYTSYDNGTKLPPVTEDEFHEFMIKNIRMRTYFARMLKENFIMLKNMEHSH